MSIEPSHHLNIVASFEEAFFLMKERLPILALYGIITMIPPALFVWSPVFGGIITILTEGLLMLCLIEAVDKDTSLFEECTPAKLLTFWEKGTVMTVLLLPLFALSFLLLIIPGIIVLSLFLFSGIIATEEQNGAIDSLMASIRLGQHHRLSVFFFAFILFFSFAILFAFLESFPLIFPIVTGPFVAYATVATKVLYNCLLLEKKRDEPEILA